MKYLTVVLLFVLIACDSSEKNALLDKPVKVYGTTLESSEWYFKSPTDSTAGIGIDSALIFLKNKKAIDVVVAVIDGPVYIHHEDLKNVIYTNPNEIDGNQIDDDNNGYVDDIHGWNYVGKKDGKSLVYGLYESTRKLKKLIKIHNIKDIQDLSGIKDSMLVQEIEVLLKEKESAIEDADSSIIWAENHRDNYYNFFKYYPELVQSGDYYTDIQWDSIKKDIKNDEHLEAIKTWRFFKKYNHSITRHNANITWHYANKYIATNINLNPEKNIDDLVNDLSYTGYGNSFVGSQQTLVMDDHGTQMAGIIGAEHNNGIGIKGVSPNVKIMPLEVYSNFIDTTKDFINAVHYATDNGAKIINYSNSRDKFILDSIAYYDAIKYATSRGVLFVCSANNQGENNDSLLGKRHPIVNVDYPGFIKVGASGEYIKDKLVYSRSSYGKKSVDIFAPGADVLTTENFEYVYKNSFGTSSAAATVSGLAALLWSYYPDFTSTEIENIIKQSGTLYDTIIETKGGKKSFSEMSQTGMIINAHKAVLLAEKRSKKKASFEK